MRQQREDKWRETLARTLARAVTGVDPDQVVFPEWPALARMKGGFMLAPLHTAPLWTFFLEAADEVIAASRKVEE